MLKAKSLRNRIFVSMILLVVIASFLIAGVTIYQYREQSKDYHEDRLQRKEAQILQSINYVLEETTYEIKPENLKYIFKEEIGKISDVQNINFNIYDLEGELMRSSKPLFEADSTANCLDAEVLNNLTQKPTNSYRARNSNGELSFQSTYVLFNDPKGQPLGIMNLPYVEDNTFNSYELQEFLMRLSGVYLLMLIAAVTLAYFTSKYITRSLETVTNKLYATELTRRNERIYIEKPTEEIGKLVHSYNKMVDALEASAAQLAKSEREQAWREMAKQVAHEIKNPLTPMRLSVQSFERKFRPNDPQAEVKLKEFSNTLVQQIDIMSNIAAAFSNFADMPAQQKETLNVVKVTKLALDIFNEPFIEFESEKEEIIAKLDRTQLIRIITNLVKNATQALTNSSNPWILVRVSQNENRARIDVIDNGIGIADEVKDKIFEPKFTTKTSGMGLGLGMVKNIIENYNGSITFQSVVGKGTTFTVTFPLE